MLREAEEILGYDLLKLCTEGPKEKLDDTTYAQVSFRVLKGQSITGTSICIL